MSENMPAVAQAVAAELARSRPEVRERQLERLKVENPRFHIMVLAAMPRTDNATSR